MKKITRCILIFVIVLLTSPLAFAGETWYIITNDEIEQDALLVGKVTQETEEYITFDVIRSVIGRKTGETFKLFFDNRMKYGQYSVGDGILVSVNFNGVKITEGTVQHGIFKVELRENKKIKMLDSGFQPCIEWFVNTGEKTSRRDGNSCYRMNGETLEMVYDGENWLEDSFDSKYTAPEVEFDLKREIRLFYNSNLRNSVDHAMLLVMLVSPILIITAIIVVVVIVKRRRKNQDSN